MDGDSLCRDHLFALGRGGDDDHDYETNGDFDRSFGIGPNSVAGTVGEDTVAPIETLDDETSTNMNYPMERFLKEQQHGDRDGEGSDVLLGKPPGSKEATHPVVMERFLKEPPAEAAAGGYEGGGLPASLAVVPPGESLLGNGTLTVSDASDSPSAHHRPHHHHHHHHHRHHHHHHHSNNDSPLAEPRSITGELALPSPSQEEIRIVLRLTEAEIQEMAAIDDASRSNAPPSERDDISELGELVSDFGMVVHTDHQNLSQGTPVTAMESVTSSLQPNTVGSVVSSDHCRSMEDDDVDGHSISSNIVASSAGGNVSLTGNPPSDIVRDDDDDDDDDDDEGYHHESGDHHDGPVVLLSPRVPTEILPTTAVDVSSRSFPESPNADASGNDPNSDLPMIPTDEGIVNRTMRPGMFQYNSQPQSQPQSQPNHPRIPTTAMMDMVMNFPASMDLDMDIGMGMDNPPKTPLSTPQKKQAGGVGAAGGVTDPPPIDHQHQHIEGFDFDKDHYSPSLVRDDQGEVVLVRNEMWSPGLSPERDRRFLSIDDAAAAAPTPTATAMPEYGAVSGREDDLHHRLARRTDLNTPELEPPKTAEPTARDGVVGSESGGGGETQPLLDRKIPAWAVASEILAGDRKALGSMLRNADERKALIESVFSTIRFGSIVTRDESNKDKDADADADAAVSAALLQQRAPPERLFALAATLLLELPVLLWVVGDRLCGMLGRSRHTALVALLPIVGALSGAVGLQASVSTTRAIVGGRVTPENYASWIVRETGAALYLGLGTGAVTGLIALLVSGFGFAFAVSIGVAQCLGTAIAGGTGSLAPVVSTALCPNDSGVWSGPLITSVQDLLGSLVVMVVSYRILAMLGPYDIAPNDVCILVDAEV